jgi:hypothetical protein
VFLLPFPGVADVEVELTCVGVVEWKVSAADLMETVMFEVAG